MMLKIKYDKNNPNLVKITSRKQFLFDYTCLFLEVIKQTPVNKTTDATIDCVVNSSFKKYHPKNMAIIGFTQADVDTFSGETDFNK